MPSLPPLPAGRGVLVRRYGADRGATWLIVFPGKRRSFVLAEGPRATATSGRSRDDLVTAIFADTCPDDGSPMRLDVVVAAGNGDPRSSIFGDPRWSQVQVGEIWSARSAAPPTALAGTSRHRALPAVGHATTRLRTAVLPEVIIHATTSAPPPDRGPGGLAATLAATPAPVRRPPFEAIWTHPASKLPSHVTPLPPTWVERLATLNAAAVRAPDRDPARLLLSFELGAATLLFPDQPSEPTLGSPRWAERIARRVRLPLPAEGERHVDTYVAI